jgi:uncharacterized beta-barrel protein YwiB (DUF1934 family)
MISPNIPVLLSVTGQSQQEGQQEERVHLVTTGLLRKTAGGYSLHYDETQPDSNETSHITLDMDKGSVTMIRDGSYATSMVFEKGRRFQGNYHTPLGDLEMGIYATRVQYTANEDKGDVTLQYQLDLQGQFVAMHQLKVNFVRQDQPVNIARKDLPS